MFSQPIVKSLHGKDTDNLVIHPKNNVLILRLVLKISSFLPYRSPTIYRAM